MPQQTDYHGYTIPVDGKDKGEWGRMLVGALDDDIDDTLIKPGLLAERDDTAPDGALYLATDERALYQYDADAGEWEDITPAGAGGGTAVGTSPTLQNQRRQWSWSDIPWEDKGEPIEDGSASGTTTTDGACYPSVIDAQAFFENPLDSYYMYWSGHDTPVGIHLSTAPELWGPWTFEQEVVAGDSLGGGHVASPCAVVDPERGRLNLYVHSVVGGGPSGYNLQGSYLLTAPSASDGTSFSEVGQVINTPADNTWDEEQRSYFQARRIGSSWIGVYQGRDHNANAPAIGVAHSYNGVDWTVEPSPAFDGTNFKSHDPNDFNGGSPALSVVGGAVHIHHNDRGNGESLALPFDTRDRALFQPGEVVYTLPDWAPSSASSVGAYDFRSDDEYLYMFYLISADQLYIGQGRAPLEEIA